MAPTTMNRAILLTATLILTIGMIDGIVSRAWDFFAGFAMVMALQLLLLARLSGRRPAVPIRRDLVAWLRDQATLGGESMESVADRAVGAYRAGFTVLDEPSEREVPTRKEDAPAAADPDQDVDR